MVRSAFFMAWTAMEETIRITIMQRMNLAKENERVGYE